jgi:hypothetical protein
MTTEPSLWLSPAYAREFRGEARRGRPEDDLQTPDKAQWLQNVELFDSGFGYTHTDAPRNQGKAMVSLIQPRRPQPRLALYQRMTRSKYRCAVQVLLTHFRRICAVTSYVRSTIPDSRG